MEYTDINIIAGDEARYLLTLLIAYGLGSAVTFFAMIFAEFSQKS